MVDLYHSLIQVPSMGYVFIMLPLSGFLSFLQNIAAFSMLSAVSPVSYSVASASKRIAIITVSLILMRNPVTFLNICGMALAVIGVLIYNKVMRGVEPSCLLLVYNKVMRGVEPNCLLL